MAILMLVSVLFASSLAQQSDARAGASGDYISLVSSGPSRPVDTCATLLADAPSVIKPCVSRFATSCIVVGATINVEKGASLLIEKCEVRMNMTAVLGSRYSVEDFHIITSWGNLTIMKSNITSVSPNNNSMIVAEPGSNFSMSDSFASKMGWPASMPVGRYWFSGQEIRLDRGIEIDTPITLFYNNTITDSNNGIWLNSSGVSMSNTRSSGLVLHRAFNNSIDNFTSSYDSFAETNAGIRADYSSGNSLRNVAAHRSNGIMVGHSSSNNTFINVNVEYGGGVGIENSNSNSFFNVTTNYNSIGVFLAYASYNSFANITARYNSLGIALTGSSYNTFIDANTSQNSNTGLSLQSSSNNTFHRLRSSNSMYGIYLFSSHNNTFIDNATNSNTISNLYTSSSQNNIFMISGPVCQCTSGACCDGCNFVSSGTSCGTTACPSSYCSENTPFSYQSSCAKSCNAAGVCNDCTCSALQEAPCSLSGICSSGRCLGCPSGFANCDISPSNGCEVNLNSNANCGSCGNACPAFKQCQNGNCVTTDPCTGVNCGSNAACIIGACSCSSGYANCDNDWMDGCETGLSTDNSNCGACGHQCATGQQCQSGVCVTTNPCAGNPDLTSCGSGKLCCAGSCQQAPPCYGECQTDAYRCLNSQITCGSTQSGAACSDDGISLTNDVCNGQGICIHPDKSSEQLCAGVSCGSNSQCSFGNCACSLGYIDCDSNLSNGCESQSLTGCPVCSAGQNRTCLTSSSCGGIQNCLGGQWRSCAALSGACTANSVQSCIPSFSGASCPALMGAMTCDACGSGFGQCIPNISSVCCPGDNKACQTIQGCSGTHVCGSSGQWDSCVAGSQICAPSNATSCTPVVNGVSCSAFIGSKNCDACGSGWSSCAAPQGVECCPGQVSIQTTGGCAGSSICGSDGTWGSLVKSDTNCGLIPASNQPQNPQLPQQQPSCATSGDCLYGFGCVDGSCQPVACNGNGVCESGEDSFNCLVDCETAPASSGAASPEAPAGYRNPVIEAIAKSIGDFLWWLSSMLSGR